MNLALTPATFAVAMLLSCIGSTVRCQTILVPSKLHVGENNTLLLISDTDTKATLSLFNKDQASSTLSQHEVQFRKGELVEYPIFLDTKKAFKEKVTLELTFDDGAKSEEDFEVSPSNGFIFFQTDKPIYRVSETVRFRILRLDRSLSPVNEKVVLKIQNHQKIKVQEVALQTKPPMHIAEYSFNFPLIAKPGIWIAEIQYGPNPKLVQSTQFEVTEYVLPTFKIEFIMDKFIMDTTTQINIGMKVSYIFGKPVQGTVHFKYSVADIEGKRSNFIGSSNTFCFDNGTFNHTADISPIREYAKMIDVRLVVEAIVKECASGSIERSRDSSVLVVRQPYSISLRKTIRSYKKGVNNYITMEVLDPHKQPVAGVPIRLSMASKDKIPINPYIISSDSTKGVPKSDQNGQVIFLFKISESTKSYDVRIETIDPNYLDSQQAIKTFTIEPFDVTEQDFIWIEKKNRLTFSVGDRFKSPIEKHGKVGPTYLVVMSKGAVIHKEKMVDNQIDFELNNRMVPSVRILIMAFNGKGEYVADSFLLNVQAGTCGVDISISEKSKRILPGGNVSFNIKGHKNDVVGFHAIDEAIYALRNTKNASRSTYSKTLEQSDAGCGPGGGGNSKEVIRSAGFKALSPNSAKKFDDNVCKRLSRKKRTAPLPLGDEEKKSCCLLAKLKYVVKNSCEKKRAIIMKYKSEACADEFFRCCKLNLKQDFQASASTANPDKPDTKTDSMNIRGQNEEVASGGVDTNMVRSDFRDTWLFDLILLNESEHNLAIVTPHSITTWFISTLSISQKHGFCLNSQHKVITFKPFFFKVAFPQTIIEHEQTEISVTIFNYHQLDHRLVVRISLNKVEGICSDWFGSKKAIRNISVGGMSSGKTAFPIIPIAKGVYQIKIEAATRGFSDTVIKNLTVLPPGIEREHQISFDLDPLNRAKRATKVENDLFVDETTNSFQRTQVRLRNKRNTGDWATNDKIVPKTLHYVVTAVGERYTPHLNSIEELSDLIKKPKGCGEQNMYYMAFNLYSLMYLDKIGKLNDKMRKKGALYLNRALNNQLTFRKNDGSYSAFYKRPASIWLTGFVAKVVCQAAPYINHDFDPKIIISALQWLQKQQQSTQGFWKEVYPILHEKALGGVQGTVPLTAYLITAFSECRSYLGKMDSSDIPLEATVDSAIKYVLTHYEKQEKWVKDLVYSQALIAYALSFSEQPKALALKQKLTGHLSRSSIIDRKNNTQYWKSDYPVETAAYALMAFIKNYDQTVDILNYISIVNWLNKQQKRGTFDNTQDTIVALEALSKYYALYKQKEKDHNQHRLLTNVTFDTRLKRSLVFNNDNADILQTIQVDRNTSQIAFETTGTGLGKVNLLIIYNEYNQNSTCRFDLEVDVFEYKENSQQNVIENVFDGSLFDDNKDMMRELGAAKSKARTSALNYNTTSITECCLNSRLAKRSIHWSALAENLRAMMPKTGNNAHTKRSEPKMQGDQPKSKKIKEFKLGPLPTLRSELDHPIVLVLNICVRHTQRHEMAESGEYLSEMAILEVSILSGYRPIEGDLKALKEESSSFIEHYDISNSKVTFYFRTVPHARLACLQFRIYQEHSVEKIQSALVRMYNYYENEWMCSRLYSHVRQTDFIKLKCPENAKTEDKCKCVTSKKCPGSEALDKVLVDDKWKQAQQAAEYLFCQYSNILNGTIQSVETVINQANYKSPVMLITVSDEIRGDTENKTIRLDFNPECFIYFQSFKRGQPVVLMHNPERDSKWLMDGNSILKVLDEKSQREMDTFVFTVRRAGRLRCQ